MANNITVALLLTGLGALGTALGGLLVVAQPQIPFRRLGILQALAAGLMLSISFMDLLPKSMEAVGFASAVAWFYAGVAFFAIVVRFIPEPSPVGEDAPKSQSHHKKHTPPNSPKGKPPRTPHTVAPPTPADARHRVLLSGLITALGIALHNFPEGIAVFLASIKSQSVGLSLAIAIAMHNVPEGIAVALPVYFATGSRWQGFKYAFLSGLAEPGAVLLLAALLPAGGLSQEVVERLLAAVGGIMAYLSLSELMPLALEHVGRHTAIVSMFAGMAIMSANLFILDHWIMEGGGHSH